MFVRTESVQVERNFMARNTVYDLLRKKGVYIELGCPVNPHELRNNSLKIICELFPIHIDVLVSKIITNL